MSRAMSRLVESKSLGKMRLVTTSRPFTPLRLLPASLPPQSPASPIQTHRPIRSYPELSGAIRTYSDLFGLQSLVIGRQTYSGFIPTYYDLLRPIPTYYGQLRPGKHQGGTPKVLECASPLALFGSLTLDPFSPIFRFFHIFSLRPPHPSAASSNATRLGA